MEVLVKCKYPRWAIQKVKSKYINSSWEYDSNNNNQVGNHGQGINSTSSNTEERVPREKPSIGHIVITYTQGLGENFKKICGKYGIQKHFKGKRTLKQLLVEPKDQDT